MTDPDYLADTRRWLERAVIGLNLCPFAKAVYVKDQVRFVLSDATTPEALLSELGEELALLRDTDPATTDTTLIVPDNRSQATHMIVDRNENGRTDAVYVDQNNDTRFDYVLYDTNEDGRTDLIGYDLDDSLEPARVVIARA